MTSLRRGKFEFFLLNNQDSFPTNSENNLLSVLRQEASVKLL